MKRKARLILRIVIIAVLIVVILFATGIFVDSDLYLRYKLSRFSDNTTACDELITTIYPSDSCEEMIYNLRKVAHWDLRDWLHIYPPECVRMASDTNGCNCSYIVYLLDDGSRFFVFYNPDTYVIVMYKHIYNIPSEEDVLNYLTTETVVESEWRVNGQLSTIHYTGNCRIDSVMTKSGIVIFASWAEYTEELGEGRVHFEEIHCVHDSDFLREWNELSQTGSQFLYYQMGHVDYNYNILYIDKAYEGCTIDKGVIY